MSDLNKNQKILFLFFSPLYTKGGHSKNFLNLIKFLSKEITGNKIKATIISFNNSKTEVVESKVRIDEETFFKAYSVNFLVRLFPSGILIFQILEFFLNLIRTFIVLFKFRPTLVYCYADKPLLMSFMWKELFGFKLIFDMRGDSINESKETGTNKLLLSILDKIYKKAFMRTNLIFSVSNTFTSTQAARVVPKYNYYDGDIFFYDEEKAKNKKIEIGLENNFVFIYNGNTHYYQMIEETIRFFSQFHQRHKDAFLIIITEYDRNYYSDLLAKNNIPVETYLIKNLLQCEIAELQSVADIGFLIRADLPLNHHSFPTKFAEYLASGVPVLMTPHIHSIAPMVRDNKLGEIIELKQNYSENVESIYSYYKNNYLLKHKCSQFANKELMWQAKAKEIFQIIHNL